MFHKKIIALAVASSFALAGCGGSSSSSSSNNDGLEQDQLVNVTAMAGANYLTNIELFSLDAAGQCLVKEPALATTDGQGQAIIDADKLSNGYCALVDEGQTLLAPKLKYLNQTTESVLSPFSTYLQLAVLEGNDPLADLASAKQALAEALQVDEALLLSDYLSDETSIARSASPVQLLSAFAQLWLLTNDVKQPFSPTEMVNLAKVTLPKLEEIAVDLNAQDNQATLAKTVTFIYNHRTDLADDSQLALLQQRITDPLIFDNLPQKPVADADALQQQMLTAIEEAVTANADPSINIELLALELTDIQADSAALQLTVAKQGADWPSELLVDPVDSSTGSFNNEVLTIEQLVFNQQGQFDFVLTAQQEISGEIYQSQPITFSIELTAAQLSNTAPEFIGMDSREAQDLLTLLNDSFEFNEAFGEPGDQFYFPADATLKPKDFSDAFNSLFSDAQESPVPLQILTDDTDHFFMDLGGSYLFTSSIIEVPAEGATSYQYRLYASDSQGARSDQGFDFLVTVNADKTASVTALDSSQNEDGNDDVVAGDSFLASMLIAEQITQLQASLENVLTENNSANRGIAVEQLFQAFNYTCNDVGLCQRGASSDYMPQVSLLNNTYLSLDNDGYFISNGSVVSTAETFTLSATDNNQPIKLYQATKVNNDYKIDGGDLNSYFSAFEITINTDGTVDIEFKK